MLSVMAFSGNEIQQPIPSGGVAQQPLGARGRRLSVADRVEALIATGKMQSQVCVARIVGVSKQRVHQIVHKRGLALKPSPEVVLEWPCPRCGQTAKSATGVRVRFRRTAFCKVCSHTGDNRGHKGYRCSVLGCNRMRAARGYCQTHYMRLIRHGDADVGRPIKAKAACQGCVVDRCPEPHYSRGHCRRHYDQLRSRERDGVEAELPLGSL